MITDVSSVLDELLEYAARSSQVVTHLGILFRGSSAQDKKVCSCFQRGNVLSPAETPEFKLSLWPMKLHFA